MYFILGWNSIDYAILYGHYNCALFLIKHDLSPEILQKLKSVEEYLSYNKEKLIKYVNYNVMLRYLKAYMPEDSVPNVYIKEDSN